MFLIQKKKRNKKKGYLFTKSPVLFVTIATAGWERGTDFHQPCDDVPSTLQIPPSAYPFTTFK